MLGLAGIASVRGATCENDFNTLSYAISDPLKGVMSACMAFSDPLTECFQSAPNNEYSLIRSLMVSNSCATCVHSVLATMLSDGTTTASSCLVAHFTRAGTDPEPVCWEEVRDLFRTTCASFSYPVRDSCTSESGSFGNASYPIGDLFANCDSMTTCFVAADMGFNWTNMPSLSTKCATCIQTLVFGLSCTTQTRSSRSLRA